MGIIIRGTAIICIYLNLSWFFCLSETIFKYFCLDFLQKFEPYLYFNTSRTIKLRNNRREDCTTRACRFTIDRYIIISNSQQVIDTLLSKYKQFWISKYKNNINNFNQVAQK